MRTNKVKMPASVARLARLYRMTALIRRVEESLAALFGQGLIPGFIHLSIGQEAVAAGVMDALGPADTIASTHRGHGHAVAKGIPLDRFFAELLARDEGVCRGRGGSMHVADIGRGMLGANGIVAAGLPIALGSALAHKTLGRAAVAVAFFGDGAMAEGLLHECLNLAKLWSLPVLFVCENNGWGEFLPTAQQIVFTLEALAKPYGIPHRAVDGNDVLAVAEAAAGGVAGVREGSGPAILECRTTRVGGHYEGDPQRGRDKAEIEALAERDPVRLARRGLAAAGMAEAEIAAIDGEIETAIAAAMAFAKAGAEPGFDDALQSVYAHAG
jgi:TPP-dependent pyruvate/acetoin dehydrogenase alpha subunit